MGPDSISSSKAQEVREAEGLDPLLAPYHRTMSEMEQMPVLERTKTICPTCKLIIDGIIYKDDDFVMIRKVCPEHGLTVEKYWEDYEMYMKMRNYSFDGRGFDNPEYIREGDNCPFDCGICKRHKTHSDLINIVVTNRCNLSCWYCFFFEKEGEPVYEPSLDDLEHMLVKLRGQKPIATNAIQITGGEPTLRKDLTEIVSIAKRTGFDQIQLNTTGIDLGLNPELLVKLRDAGLSTLYMSFDGVTKRANPKNHWEVPLILDAARKAGVGIVLVPTVIRTVNDSNLGPMINFALNNIDIVRSINFQPVSLVGRMPEKQREQQRITIPGAVKLIEQQTAGIIAKEDWFTVPYTGGISKFIEALTGKYKYEMSVHFACGVGTYLFLDDDRKVIPITRFVDATGLFEYLQDVINEMQGKRRIEKRLIVLKSILGLKKFVDEKKQPKSINFINLFTSIFVKHDFSALGEFQMKSLFLGMMHFQDEYNYDIRRVERCGIHYVVPDGRVIPFCTFNVIPEIYRDKIQKQYSIPVEEWQASHPGWSYAAEKYRRNTQALEANELYKKTYGNLVNFFPPADNPDSVEKVE